MSVAPLVPVDADLRDFAFMPLDVRRLRDSDLASDETPEACWAALLLWCASWHQIPAGSIPDSDGWQAKQAGYSARGRIDEAWASVRDGALRGWIKCSDGRLYHPVVAEKAVEAWQQKLAHAHRRACDRIRKDNKARAEKGLDALPIPDFDAWNSGRSEKTSAGIPPETPERSAGIPPENTLKGQGQGQGQGQGLVTPAAPVGPVADKPATADRPVDEAKAEIWRAGPALLIAAGKSPANARTLIGKLCKEHGEINVLASLRAAAVEEPIDPASWLVASLLGTKRPGKQVALESRNTDALTRFLETT